MFQYSLRFTLAPSRNFDKKMAKLLDFCQKAEIDDVMFFIAVEDLGVGHITKEEAKPWVETIAQAKRMVEKCGMSVSLNPWTTLAHNDGGRKLKAGQNFRTMVGIDGTQTETVACPLCKNWRKYFVELMSYYVQALSPEVLWFEDDLRLSNHEPVSFGCFCEEHVRRINERLSTNYDRETLVKKILSDKVARRAFLEEQRFTMEDTISYIVRNLPAQKTFGMMTSGAGVALSDARRNDVLYTTLAQNGGKPYNRVNLGGYRQCGMQAYAWGVNASAMWYRHIAGDKACFVSEIENVPHSLYTKSAHFLRYQMLTALPVCLDGATLSIFEFNGNGIVNGDRYAAVLKEIKPFLSAVWAKGLSPEYMGGVYVLYHEEAAFTRKNPSQTIQGLIPDENWWFCYLEQLGVACTYGVDVGVKGRVVALGGEVLRNYTTAEIRALFKNNFVLLNADCANTLFELGLQDLIHASAREFWTERGGNYSMEQLACGGEIFGEEELRALAIYFCGDHLHVSYTDENRKTYTNMLDYYENIVGEGIVQTGNALIFPYTGKSRDLNMPISLLCPLREYAIKQAIEQSGIDAKGLCFVQEENVCPYLFEKDGKTYIMLVNFSDDEYESVHIMKKERYQTMQALTVDAPAGKEVSFSYEGGMYALNLILPACSSLLLVCER